MFTIKEEVRKPNLIALWTLVIAASLIVICMAYCDTDIMWHFKLGEYITSHKALPVGDIFSWQKGLSNMCHEWLYDIYLFGLYTVLGVFGMRISVFLPLISTLFIIFWNNRDMKSPMFFAIYIISLIFSTSGSFSGRPSEYSMILFMMTALLLRNSTDKKKNYIVLFIFGVINANIHGGSIVQLMLIPLIYVLADAFISFTTKHLNGKETITMLSYVIPIFLGSLINPYGASIWKYFLSSIHSDNIANQYIVEWMPLQCSLPFAFLIFASVIAMSTEKKFRQFDRKTLMDFLLIMAFLVESFAVRRMVRNATWLLMLLGYQYIESYYMYVTSSIRTDIKFKIREYVSSEKLHINSIDWLFLNKAFLTLAFLSLFMIFTDTYQYVGVKYKDYVAEQYENLDEITDYLKEKGINEKLYCGFNGAGYLILDNVKTFIDPRCDPFVDYFSKGNNSLNDYLQLMNNHPYQEFSKLRDKYDLQYAIFDKDYTTEYNLWQLSVKDGAEELISNERYVLLELPDEITFIECEESCDDSEATKE